MLPLGRNVLNQLIVVTACIHVLLVPYTKVEESFNLHATHDALMYGVGPAALQNYDHFVFPGAVPRTFLGSIVLAWITKPIVQLVGWARLPDKFGLQIAVRLVLAAVNATALGLVRQAVSRRFGHSTGVFFVLLTCSQFHLPFWMGRTLPNMFALYPVNIALYLILLSEPQATNLRRRKIHAAIALLTFATVVFRSEIVLLMAPIVLQFLWLGYTSFSSVVKAAITSGVFSLVITVGTDSYFWKRWPLWPEFSGFYFNVFQGKSSDWGISPLHTYFTSFLPKLLLSSLPLSLLGIVLDPSIRTLILPPVVYVCLMSCLGHKEWRFIIYVVPFFNIAAARGASWMASRRKVNVRGYLFSLIAIGMILANVVLTTLQTIASIHNYPGGQAMALFNSIYDDRPHVHVHISNLAAQTGASLYLQTHAPPYRPFFNSSIFATDWTYDKTEFLSLQELTAAREITHLIAEEPCSSLSMREEWEYVGSVYGFEGWKLDLTVIKEQKWWRLSDVLTMLKQKKLCILERSAPETDHRLLVSPEAHTDSRMPR